MHIIFNKFNKQLYELHESLQFSLNNNTKYIKILRPEIPIIVYC